MTALYDMRDVGHDLQATSLSWRGLFADKKSSINILSGVTLSIGKGETMGLVGESGSGKTTLARVLLGLKPATSGELAFEGRPLKAADDFAHLRRNCALMFQDPVASLSPRMKVENLVTEPFIIHGIKMQNRTARAVELLERVGLPANIALRYPHELSGGQARRVCVARALALNPKLVIADEPTAGLDVSVQNEILNLMTELKNRLEISFLIITHNLAMVRHVTDRVAIMYLGRLVEQGPTREVFAKPLHPYTKSLIASEPQPDPRKRRKDPAIKGEIPGVLARPSGCEFHTRCAHAQPRCTAVTPENRTLAPGRIVRCHLAEHLI